MTKQHPETKLCKHCKTEIPYDAKVCPNCRKKQGMSLVLKIVIVILILGLIGALLGGDKSTSNDSSNSSASSSEKNVETKEEVIEYTVVTIDDLTSELKSNAMKAKNDYEGKYIEITGYVSVIDASGKYISIDNGDSFTLDDILCDIKNEDTKNKVMELTTDQKVTIKGKITSVGEILGYSLDIIELQIN